MSDTDVTGPSGDIDEGTTTVAEPRDGSGTAGPVDAGEDVAAAVGETPDRLDDAEDGPDDEEPDDESDDDEAGDEAEHDESDDDRARSGRRSRRAPSLKRLEEEGDVAADYLEVLLDITDLDGDIDIDVENGRASVAIVAEGSDRELRRLVGARGEVLEALQELSRLAVQAATGERSRLMLDVAGFRAARRRTLEGVAAKACEEVVKGGQPVRLEPMSAFERKVVHDVVAGAGLRSESEGEEPSRRVVVFPASA